MHFVQCSVSQHRRQLSRISLYSVHYCNYDVILICESWLSEGATDGLFDPECKYSIIRRDRTTGRGGGVCIAVSRGMSYIEIQKGSDGVELLCIDVLCGRSKNRFVLVYRPLRYDADSKQCTANIIKSLTSLCEVKYHVFIVGDIDCPDICWQSFTAPGDKIQDCFLDFVCESGFLQFVTEGTRERNILDLVLCSEPLILTRIDVQCPIGSSDHNSVQFSITAHGYTESPPSVDCDNDVMRVYAWDGANYDGISAF